MTFEPQVPDWGKQLVGDNLDQLIIYHDWLCNTGITVSYTHLRAHET